MNVLVPPPAIRQLRGFQDRGVTYLYEASHAVLMLMLGGGKTAIALHAIAELVRDGHIRHALVMAPKRVAELVWQQELAEWANLTGIGLTVVGGPPERRKALLASAPSRQITVIGIDHTQWLVEELRKLPPEHLLFDLLCVDEISRFKDPDSKRARALATVIGRFRIRWGLTGTIRPNGERDLFMPAWLITDGQLSGRSFHRWQQERFRPHFNGYSWSIKPEWAAPTAAEFATITMTVDEADLPELPEIHEVIDTITLPAAARQAYDALEGELVAEIEGKSVAVGSQMLATGKLAQLVAGFLYGENGSVTRIHHAKIEWLQEIIDSLAGEPLLMAYEFLEDTATLRRLFGSDLPILGGGTSAAEAERHVAAWNRSELPLMALHPASAGHGLNLQHGGARLAWLGMPWSAELYEQTVKRIHRPGQNRHCTVHICLAKHTIDEMKRDRVLSKITAQEAFRHYLARL